jgi:hypothetical protein
LAAGYTATKPPREAREDLLSVLKGVVSLAGGAGSGAGDTRRADILASLDITP